MNLLAQPFYFIAACSGVCTVPINIKWEINTTLNTMHIVVMHCSAGPTFLSSS